MRMERNNDRRSDEQSGRIQRSRPLNVARVERQIDAGHTTAGLVVSASRLIEQSLDVYPAFERISRVKTDRNPLSTTFDFRITSSGIQYNIYFERHPAA